MSFIQLTLANAGSDRDPNTISALPMLYNTSSVARVAVYEAGPQSPGGAAEKYLEIDFKKSHSPGSSILAYAVHAEGEPMTGVDAGKVPDPLLLEWIALTLQRGSEDSRR